MTRATIDKYISVFNIGLQNTFVYRWNYFLRALFGLIPLAGTVFLWSAVFKERGGGLHGYDYSSMIYYYLLAILVSNLVTPTEDEWQIAADIREGQINALLTKPMSYLAYRFSIFCSGRLVYTFVTLPPIALIFIYFRDYIVLPHDPLIYLFATLSMLMSALIQFFITYSLAMMAFWILEISTIVFIVYSFEYFLGGQMHRAAERRAEDKGADPSDAARRAGRADRAGCKAGETCASRSTQGLDANQRGYHQKRFR